MAMAVAISPGILIFLLHLQNILAEQCLNNENYKNLPGIPQQNFQKSSCGLNQVAQNGINYNSPQQRNMQQMHYQQNSNNQQLPFTQQASNQQQLFLQQSNAQPADAMSNSQLLKQPSQDLAANIFSALYNIKPSSQNQRDARNIVKGNSARQMNYEAQTTSQNQPNPTLTESAPMNKPQNNQPPVTNAYAEYSPVQPAFTFKFVPNIPLQPNQQTCAVPIQKPSANDQNQVYSIQSQPIINSATTQQAAVQSPIVMIPGTPTNALQNQPVFLTFQSPQVSTVQNQPTVPTQTDNKQPIIYTVQTQPSAGFTNQNQQILSLPSQKQITNNPMDNQSLISYVMSQMQNANTQGSGNMLASILPTMLNSKSEKSSSTKALLPLIFNMLNEKKGCGGCPHCGCNNNNNQNKPEPIVNTGYSNQINYSQQKLAAITKNTDDLDKSLDSISNEAKQEMPKDEVNKNGADISEEEANEEEEEYDDE